MAAAIGFGGEIPLAQLPPNDGLFHHAAGWMRRISRRQQRGFRRICASTEAPPSLSAKEPSALAARIRTDSLGDDEASSS
jgi:hypothetical protein